MRVVLFETEHLETKAWAALMRQHDVRGTTVPLNSTTVDDFKDAEVISPFVVSRRDAGIVDAALRRINKTTLANIEVFAGGRSVNVVQSG